MVTTLILFAFLTFTQQFYSDNTASKKGKIVPAIALDRKSDSAKLKKFTRKRGRSRKRRRDLKKTGYLKNSGYLNNTGYLNASASFQIRNDR